MLPLTAQEPQGDSVTFESDGLTLTGFLRVPEGEGPFPAVLFLPGGGRQFLHFEPDYFARQFAAAGYASLVFDKRGTGRSEGDWPRSTLGEFVDDAAAAVEVLRSHAAIDGRIAVMGFSQGGRLAPAVARRTSLDAVISIVGPRVSVSEVRLFALENAFREGGANESDIRAAMALWREHFDLFRRGMSLAPLDERVRASDVPGALRPPTTQTLTPHPVWNSVHFDSEPAVRSLAVPTLALFGEDDLTVPTARSVDILEASFRGREELLTLLVIPGAGHTLDGPDGQRHPLYEQTPLEWLRQHLPPEG